MEQYILALDQGTTASRAILFDQGGNAVRKAQNEFAQIYQSRESGDDPMVSSTVNTRAARTVMPAGCVGRAICASASESERNRHRRTDSR
jgi:sugar (pentulose or hexulose) kinase